MNKIEAIRYVISIKYTVVESGEWRVESRKILLSTLYSLLSTHLFLLKHFQHSVGNQKAADDIYGRGNNGNYA